MLQDVRQAVGRFVEVDGNGDATGTRYGEVCRMPLRPVGGEQAYAVARLYAEFDERHGKSGDPAQEFRGGDGLPDIVAANQLSARIGIGIDGVQEPQRKSAVVHQSFLTLLYPSWARNSYWTSGLGLPLVLLCGTGQRLEHLYFDKKSSVDGWPSCKTYVRALR